MRSTTIRAFGLRSTRVRHTTLVIVSAALVTACIDKTVPISPATRASEVQNSVEEVLRSPKPRQVGAEEQAIIDSLVQLHPEQARTVRAMLTDRRVASMGLPHKDATRLLARLDSVRTRREMMMDVRPQVFMATVVLADEVRHADADVVVIRRAHPPMDYIVLDERKASAAAIGAGVATLFKLRRELGDVPTRDMQVTVANARMPETLRPELKAEAARLLGDLKRKDKANIRGIGNGRAVEIPLVGVGS